VDHQPFFIAPLAKQRTELRFSAAVVAHGVAHQAGAYQNFYFHECLYVPEGEIER
jgi:hypothetical protein